MLLLLNNGADILINERTPDSDTPVDYSIYSRCSEAVRLLLRNDSLYLGRRQLSNAIKAKDDVIISYIVEELRDRRGGLKKLAKDALPNSTLNKVGLKEDRLPDAIAHLVQDALLYHNVRIPDRLRVFPQEQTILFHMDNMTAKTAQSLYESGFRDLNSINAGNVTPLMKVLRNPPWEYDFGLPNAATLADWYLKKGSKPTAAYMIGFFVNIILSDRVYEFPPPEMGAILDTALERLPISLFKALQAAWTDWRPGTCVCACSSRGCSPFSPLSRLSLFKELPAPLCRSIRMMIIERVESRLDSGKLLPWLANELIQFETFEALQISHTCRCCKFANSFNYYLHPWYSALEVERIWDEEQELIDKLHQLTAEFNEQFGLEGGSVVSFLKGHWNHRMREHLQKSPVLTAGDRAKIIEIGVVLDYENEEEGDGLFDEEFFRPRIPSTSRMPTSELFPTYGLSTD